MFAISMGLAAFFVGVGHHPIRLNRPDERAKGDMMRDRSKKTTFSWVRVPVIVATVCLMIGIISIMNDRVFRHDILGLQISHAAEDSETAEATVEDLMSGYNKAQLKFQEADLLQAKGRYPEAIEAFEKVVARSFCGNAVAEIKNRKGIGKGECHEALGNFKEAYVEYLLCIPNMGLTMAVEPLLGMRRLRPKLSEVEKREVDDHAFGILLRFIRQNRGNVLYARESGHEDRRFASDQATYGYLYDEAERFGLMSSFDRAEKKLQSAKYYESINRYKDASLDYIEFMDIPWLHSSPGPAESLISLRTKLKGSERRELDARLADRLSGLVAREDVRNELQSFAVHDPDPTRNRWRLDPEAVVYPFLLDEAERLGVDAPTSAADMRLKIARYYDGNNIFPASFAYEAYLACIKTPWPYPHAEPIEKLPGLREKLEDYERKGADAKTRARLTELLSAPEVREKVELLARLGDESANFGEPEHAVYAFLLAESRRLGLLAADSESRNSVK